MKSQKILDDVAILVEQVTGQKVTMNETTFVRNTQLNVGEECLDLSSLELIEVVVLLEEKYEIRITNDDVLQFVQISDMIQFIQKEIGLEKDRLLEIEHASQQIFGE